MVNRVKLRSAATMSLNESQENQCLTSERKTKHSARQQITKDDSVLNKGSSIQVKEETFIFPKDAEHELSYEKMVFETKRIHPHIIIGSSIDEE
jgi:hypothetical protein